VFCLGFTSLFQNPWWDMNRCYIARPAAKEVRKKQKDILKNAKELVEDARKQCRNSMVPWSSLKFLEQI